MKILLWHGYLLHGTGSNVYTRALAREWSRAGHDVVVVCQERHPERYDLAGTPVVVPALPDRLLPVFVLDRYEGLEARLLQDFTPEERERYVDANARALRELLPADVLFTNHVLMGGPVGAATAAPFRRTRPRMRPTTSSARAYGSSSTTRRRCWTSRAT